MRNFKVGETVAVNLCEDQNLTNRIVFSNAFMQEYYNHHYKEHSTYKRCKIRKRKGFGSVFLNVCICSMMDGGTAPSN